jgi:hypothetical protein
MGKQGVERFMNEHFMAKLAISKLKLIIKAELFGITLSHLAWLEIFVPLILTVKKKHKKS